MYRVNTAFGFRVVVGTLFGVFSLLGPGSAQAVTFTVNSLLDEPDTLASPGICRTAANTCTLRAALMQANRSSGVGATVVVPAGTYTLIIPASGSNGESNGDLNLTAPSSGNPLITISGAGAGSTIIDANQLDRALRVHSGRTAVIENLTIRNGFTPASEPGGGLSNEGTLTMNNSVITLNESLFIGGGAHNSGTMTLVNSTVSANRVKGMGLGAGLYNSGTLYLKSSTVSGNAASYNGGGLYSAGPNTFVVDSTFSGNEANGSGGGIYLSFGNANVYSSSIVFNGADADADPNGGSGGIFNSPGATFNLRNTLVAGNYVSGVPVYRDCTGTFGSYGRNLFGDVTGCTVNTVTGTWGLLGSLGSIGLLQDNGGPTLTHALIPPTNAIDGGDPVFGCTDYAGAAIALDQRGMARVSGARCDIGAFEFVAAHLDVDDNKRYDALTDGVLIVRYLFGFTGTALTNGAVGTNASRVTAAQITPFLDVIRRQLDVDGNQQTGALTDGLMLLRYLFGLRGQALIAGAVGPSATRTSAAAIETYIQTLLPAIP